jgi:hypothetical protein
MLARAGLGAGTLLLLVVLLMAVPTTAAAPAGGPTGSVAANAVPVYNTSTWAGYHALNANNASVTMANGSWVQPAVNCSVGTGVRDVRFWVGIGETGVVQDEQIGTAASCSGTNASYTAWWDMTPTRSYQTIANFSVLPGDLIHAAVTFSAGNFTFRLRDGVQVFQTTGTQGTNRNVAYCIVTRPSVVVNGTTVQSRLADFGRVTFTTCRASIAGVTGSIAKLPGVAGFQMVSTAPHAPKIAKLSTLGPDGSFRVTWLRGE